MKKCFDITRLLCLSVLLSVFCFSSVLAAAAGEAPALRVALLLEDAAPDRGWNDLLRQGLEQARKELGVRTAVVVAPPQGSNGLTQEGIFRAAARQADLVLLSGARLHEILRNNAANFRQTKFGCIDTGIRAANIMCVTFADEQAAFLAGAAAAMLTADGTQSGSSPRALGWLSAYETGAVRTMLNGFLEGARLVTPDMRILHRVIGSWTDTAAARAAVQEMLDQGAAVVVLSAGRAGLGTLDLLRQRQALAIGMDADQDSLMPGTVLTSIRKRADRAVEELVTAYADDRFQGAEIITYTLENGGVDITNFASYAAAGKPLPPRLLQRCKELRMELSRGSIRLPSLRQGTLCNCR